MRDYRTAELVNRVAGPDMYLQGYVYMPSEQKRVSQCNHVN